MCKTPVFHEYLVWLRTGDPKLLVYLETFLWYGKKLDVSDQGLNTTAMSRWYSVEEKLERLDLPNGVPLRGVFEKIFPPPIYPPFIGHNGPGSVAERGVKGNAQKCEHFGPDPRLDAFVMRVNNLHADHEYKTSETFCKESSDGRPIPAVQMTARMRRVRKNIKTARTICMEPAKVMYVQQYMRRVLEAQIASSLLADSIRIDDQSVNQEAARYGSLTKFIDTIDLSDASDSVSSDLVKKVFPPAESFMLFACRTNEVSVEEGKDPVVVKKFAPMGSAVCFPVQSMIYATIVYYAALEWYGKRHGIPVESLLRQDGPTLHRRIFHSYVGSGGRRAFAKLEPIAVYGDDICVDSRITARVIDLLTVHGFTVNSAKSFTSQQNFRESCGGYYWDGEDVTPLLYRVKLAQEELTAESFESLIAMANRSGDWGYKNLHRFFIQLALFTPIQGVWKPPKAKNLIQFSPIRGIGIYHPNPKNGHLGARTPEHNDPSIRRVGKFGVYQRPWFQNVGTHVLRLGYRKRERVNTPNLDAYLYSQFWYRRSLDSSTPEFLGDERSEGRKLTVRRVWTALDE
jgi:hypothetical protein